MTTRGQILSLAGGVTVLALALALPAFFRHGDAPAGNGASISPPAPVATGTAATSASPAAAQGSSNETVVPALPANATHVPDEYLLKLSAMVNLLNAEERRINKERWREAVPIAERLAQGPCDCEQRNWLNHFVAMGKQALAGADEEYYRSAILMQTMARNDRQLADHPEFFAR